MLYVANGNVYVKDNAGRVFPADVTAKDKVVERRELASISVKPRSETVELPKDARPATLDEVSRKFALAENHPATFSEERHNAALGIKPAPARSVKSTRKA